MCKKCTYIASGVQEFSKNLAATPKFQAPDGWHETRSILRTHKYWGPQYKIQSSTTDFSIYMVISL